MDIVSRVLDWADHNDSVRVMLLVGSLGQNKHTDNFSDFDLSIFGYDFDFIRDDDWLLKIAAPIVCIHDQFQWGQYSLPTRLTLFDDMTKVDFAFHPLSLLQEMINAQTLSPTYGNGYLVLIDKEGIGQQIPPPDFHAHELKKPDAKEFQLAINEFWFEAYHVVKYLSRKDLWAAKSRDCAIKSWLLSMLQWHAVARAGSALQLKNEGREMQSWIDPNVYAELNHCFGSFNHQQQWSALLSTTKLFSKLTHETASGFDFSYNDVPEKKITEFIFQLNPKVYG